MQKVDTLLRLMLHASLRLLAAAVYDRHYILLQRPILSHTTIGS